MRNLKLETALLADHAATPLSSIRRDVFMRTTGLSVAVFISLISMSASSIASTPTSCLNQNFDSIQTPALPNGWTSTRTIGSATSSPFATRGNVNYADSGSNTTFVDDYLDYTDISLYSPVFDVIAAGGAPTVTFRHSYFLWAPSAGPNYQGAYNGAVLEISMNGGQFADIITAGGSLTTGIYSTFLDPNFDNPIAEPPLNANRHVWSGDSGGFKTVTVALPDFGNKGVAQLRWRLGTEGGGRSYDTHSGWWIDSVSYSSVGNDVLFRNGFENACE